MVNHKRRWRVWTRATTAVCLLGMTEVIHGQVSVDDAAIFRATQTAVYVDACSRIDALLRSTCANIGRQLSETNKRHCDLPPESFETRVARRYAAFMQDYHAELVANETKIAGLQRKVRAAFERQFAQVRAGNVSMLDLESLGRELAERCSVIEREWLVQRRRPN